MASAGGVLRRCGCADPVTGRQLGGNCPRLADDGHGSWYIQLELPAALDGGRRRIRRGGYTSSHTAEVVLAGLRMPASGDPHADVLTVGDWLLTREAVGRIGSALWPDEPDAAQP
jgi:hypothetical protein